MRSIGRQCALLVTQYLAACISQLTASTCYGRAEEAQDVVSCLYLLLQRHGSSLSESIAAEATVVSIGHAMLAVLQASFWSQIYS